MYRGFYKIKNMNWNWTHHHEVRVSVPAKPRPSVCLSVYSTLVPALLCSSWDRYDVITEETRDSVWGAAPQPAGRWPWPRVHARHVRWEGGTFISRRAVPCLAATAGTDVSFSYSNVYGGGRRPGYACIPPLITPHPAAVHFRWSEWRAPRPRVYILVVLCPCTSTTSRRLQLTGTNRESSSQS